MILSSEWNNCSLVDISCHSKWCYVDISCHSKWCYVDISCHSKCCYVDISCHSKCCYVDISCHSKCRYVDISCHSKWCYVYTRIIHNSIYDNLHKSSWNKGNVCQIISIVFPKKASFFVLSFIIWSALMFHFYVSLLWFTFLCFTFMFHFYVSLLCFTEF